MTPAETTRLSKLLSLVLRHRPGDFGLALDPQGFVDLEALFAALAKGGETVTRDDIARVLAAPAKSRFELDASGRRIRAVHGHSVPVELGYVASTPPEMLFHGTVNRFLPAIRKEGLAPRKRQHVHLAETEEAALEVGSRRGEAILLRILAGEMSRAGHSFYRSASGVWLTDGVPPRFLVEAVAGE